MTMPISPVGYPAVQSPTPVEERRADERVVEAAASDTSNSTAARRHAPEGMGRVVDKRA